MSEYKNMDSYLSLNTGSGIGINLRGCLVRHHGYCSPDRIFLSFRSCINEYPEEKSVHGRRRRGAGGRDNATLGTRGREQRQLRKGSAKPTSLPRHPSSDIFNNQNSDDRSELNHH